MGQNIGTCVTALLSSFGANKNAKRAAVIHLAFNVIGTVVWLSVFALVSAVLERIAYLVVPEGRDTAKAVELDERLLATPSIALGECHKLTLKMAEETVEGFRLCLNALGSFDSAAAERIRAIEKDIDHYEDILGTYLTKLARAQISDDDSSEVSKLLKIIGDLERISDHSVNVMESVEEIVEKKIEFSEGARKEMAVLCGAVEEILRLTMDALNRDDADAASCIEPLEQVVDHLKAQLRNRHIARLKKGECSVEAGFVWSDLLTDLERTSDHCSNIALSILDALSHNMNAHQALRSLKKNGPGYLEKLDVWSRKFSLPQA
jgi:phosphate:Na+ symporter